MINSKDTKMFNLLEKSEKARNGSSKELELEYLLEYICKNEAEKMIIKEVLTRPRPSGASLKRIRANIQNTQELYQASPEVQKKRKKLETKVREELSPINRVLEGFSNWFNNK